MIEDKAFVKNWFKSIESFLKESDMKDAERFLQYCAEGCSKSYSLAVYENAFIKGESLEESMQILAQGFEDFSYAIKDDYIEISYSRCGCDLVKSDLMRSNLLCTCSKLSLHFNWSAIFGPENVRVDKISTLLGGGKRCLFEVRVRQLGHHFSNE